MELFDASGSVLATGRSDEKGRYEQGRMQEGVYRIRVVVPGYRPIVREFEVVAGEATRLALTLVPEAPRLETPTSRPVVLPVAPPTPAVAVPSPPTPVASPAASEAVAPVPSVAPPAPTEAPQLSPEPQTSGEPPAS
jgi:hypothetical protein